MSLREFIICRGGTASAINCRMLGWDAYRYCCVCTYVLSTYIMYSVNCHAQDKCHQRDVHCPQGPLC